MLGRDFRVFYLCLFFIPLFLNSNSLDQQKLLNLSKNRYWHTLLHFRDGKSEIDDPKFFLSNLGKVNPKDELEATIKALRAGEIDCRFPSRVVWLQKQFPEFSKVNHECKELEDIITKYDPNHVYIIFPTAHINSPASMYGHTFLRVDSDEKTQLISNAINYAAKTDESNGLLYAYYGLIGGYKGMYSISPYYDKIKEYNDMERRDIWEYKLNLTKLEIKKMLMHQYELRDIYSDYFFFTENCSYNLLWLLEVAKPDVRLTNQFGYKAIPIDTLRAIKGKGLLGKSKFRPSKSKKMKQIIQKIKNTEISSLNKRVYKLDLEIEKLRFKRAKNRIDKKKYIKTLMELLRERSQFKVKSDYKVKREVDPMLGHKTGRFLLGLDTKDRLKITFKPAFHDRLDLDYGFTNGAYINFFNLAFVKDKNQDLKLEKFDFIDITSYSPRDDYFKPLSWSVIFGFDRDYNDDLNFYFSAGIGYSYEFGGFLYHVTLDPALYMSSNTIFSISPKIGVIKNYKYFKLGIDFKREFITTGKEVTCIDTFLTYKLKKDFALNLKYDITDKEKRAGVSLLYYF